MQQPKIDLIAAWLEKADHDFGTAKVLLRHAPEYEDSIAFHCQQAVEKLLKTYMICLDLVPPKTHDLVVLSELIKASGASLPDFKIELRDLTQFAVTFRYPDANSDVIPVSFLLGIMENVDRTIKQLLRENGFTILG